MENGSIWGNWLAYVAIVLFLLFLLALIVRTMMLFGTLTLMPISRILRPFTRIFGRRKP